MWVWIWMAAIVTLSIIVLRLRNTTYYLSTAAVCFIGAAATSAFNVYIWLSPEVAATLSSIPLEFVIVFIFVDLCFFGMFLLTLGNINEERDNLQSEIDFLHKEKETAREEMSKLKQEIIELKFG